MPNPALHWPETSPRSWPEMVEAVPELDALTPHLTREAKAGVFEIRPGGYVTRLIEGPQRPGKE